MKLSSAMPALRALLLGALVCISMQTPAQTAPRVKLDTSAGEIVLELSPEKAPKTVENFLQYVKDKHYDGTIFHRVIPDFMIQGGGMVPQMYEKKTRPPIALEARNGLRNDRGTVAMARTSAPDSATSQFFINVVDNGMLNAPQPDGHGYAVFGKVVSGMEIVDRIRATPTMTRGMHQNVPVTPILLNSATIVK